MDKKQLNNPWKGLNFYTEGEILYGRNAEIQSLSQYIFNNNQTVLYGRSGIGKSSILYAGIYPKARLEGMTPVSIRLKHDDVDNYIWQIRSAIKDSGLKMKSLLPSINGKECETLWEFMHRHTFYNTEGKLQIPLLVFDQFEEIFTLQKNENVKRDFFKQLGNLLNDVKPDYIAQSEKKNRLLLAEGQETKVISSGAFKGLNLKLNIRRSEINGKNSARYLEHPDYHIVFAMREDFLSSLELYASSIPVMKDNRFGLLPINEEQAADIIRLPRKGLVDDEVTKLIIQQVTNRNDFELDGKPEIEVDAAVLSLFLSRLFVKKTETEQQITSHLVNTYSGHIIYDFYVESITSNEDKNESLDRNTILLLEDQLLTHEGRRNNVSRSDLIAQGITTKELDILINKRKLLRQFNHGNDIRIEYIHDILCPIVKERKKQREMLLQQELEHKKQEKEKQKLLQEKKLLQEQKEKERTERNIEYNRKKRATERNVLTHKGRRLLDNAIDFGEYRTLLNVQKHNPVDNFLDLAKYWSRFLDEYLVNTEDSEFTNQQVFSDPLLKDSLCVLSFYRDYESAPTIDGIYGVELKYNGILISDIFFKGKKVLNDGSLSFDEPIYILGGYSGIHIDYDDNNREIQRTYLDEDGDPITTQEGYSVVKTQYDEFGNPVRIRYYNKIARNIIPARHINGNYGYNSIFDKNGNEIERYFTNYSGQKTTIISGVYGKRMLYDKELFHLTSISNLDENGNLMADLDGYVTVNKFYDENGFPTIEMYVDENGKPMKTPDGTFGNVVHIDFIKQTFISYYINASRAFITNDEGVSSVVVQYNKKRQITELYNLDTDNNVKMNDDGVAFLLFGYDEQGKLLTFKSLSKERKFLNGCKFDYNKEGTHVIRQFALPDDKAGMFEEYGVEGVEFMDINNGSLPVLQIFINENKQFKPCKDGYNAVRKWEDAEERIVKQLFYNVDGTPMQNNDGVFGEKYEYLDEHTTRTINLDANENIMEDYNGVAFIVQSSTSQGTITTSFNLNYEPYANDEWVYIYQERHEKEQGHQEKLFVKNAYNEQIVIQRPHLANPEWDSIPCMCVETDFDDKGRPITEYFKDSEGNLVGDADGDSFTTWEYNDSENTEILSLYNTESILKIRIKTKKDDKGRIIEKSYLNKDNNYIELECGYSGELCEYDDEEKRKIVTYINSNGEICNNNEGFAHRIYWFDNVGRPIAQKDVTVDGKIYGFVVFKEFLDSEKRECVYYVHREDGQGNIVSNEQGVYYSYFEDDCKGRTLKELYLNKDKSPMADEDGDFGLSYEYNEEQNFSIVTCLDENGQPHTNKLGYGIIYLYKDEKGREIKRMYFDINRNPIAIQTMLDCYGITYEYPNENNRIVGYLNEKGEITKNKYGYAYREECFDSVNGIRHIHYYDETRNNVQSLENDNKEFGYAIVQDENWRRILSLGKDGQLANNACGYAIKYEFYENGNLCFYKYHNVEDQPIADNVGDYGTEIQRSDDGSLIRLVGLDDKYECHLNDYGYCSCDIITDIAGDQVQIWRNLNGNQVLPKLRFAKKIKRCFSLFKKSKKVKPIFNCRQIGAIFNCVIGNIEGKGLGEKYGLTGIYVLLKYDNWSIGNNTEELEMLLTNTKIRPKSLLLLPIALDGSLLISVGDIIELALPAGEMGMRFANWDINVDTLRTIMEKKAQWETSIHRK